MMQALCTRGRIATQTLSDAMGRRYTGSVEALDAALEVCPTCPGMPEYGRLKKRNAELRARHEVITKSSAFQRLNKSRPASAAQGHSTTGGHTDGGHGGIGVGTALFGVGVGAAVLGAAAYAKMMLKRE